MLGHRLALHRHQHLLLHHLLVLLQLILLVVLGLVDLVLLEVELSLEELLLLLTHLDSLVVHSLLFAEAALAAILKENASVEEEVDRHAQAQDEVNLSNLPYVLVTESPEVRAFMYQ